MQLQMTSINNDWIHAHFIAGSHDVPRRCANAGLFKFGEPNYTRHRSHLQFTDTNKKDVTL